MLFYGTLEYTPSHPAQNSFIAIGFIPSHILCSHTLEAKVKLFLKKQKEGKVKLVVAKLRGPTFAWRKHYQNN